MEKNYRVTTFVMDSGERYCMVVDRASGLPMYYPTLFLTTQIRNKGNAFSTTLAAANNLVLLLRFLESRDINLEQRFLTKDFFKPHELDDLRDFAQRKQGRMPSKALSNPWLDDELTNIVDNGTQHSRLTTFANYLRWYAMHLLKMPELDVGEQIKTMATQIKVRRPSKKSRNSTLQDRSLSDVQLDALFELIQPGSASNPFSIDVQRRNRLMILLLFYLGIRGGELLNIRIQDIDFSTNRIHIVRRADERADSRTNEPNAKTRERLLPLAESLVQELHGYITQDRRNVRNAKKNDYLFVTYKRGPTVGNPISKAGYHKIFSVVRAVSPQLYAASGHSLRHTWNRKFSERMDAMDEQVSEERQEQVRSYLMGWREGSGTAATYNKRFIQQKGFEAALALQKANGTRLPEDLKNDDE
ncbi:MULTISPECIES: tyrosine-type recombinase/integrase [Enterobacteriaceae]|uniref:tyrosine-type recombinase/integrase n=1 Tax=Enterobacteriaceae TaxID=543 RepID=UPI000DE391F0|nr:MULTISPECIES: site-specific integrase [Enterobacteriaceae]HBU6715313.1 site-specific integrase [Serratia marcescens]HDZ9396686.1 site-specific integrase [Klebsiella variicola subsp. variicola]MBX4608583.1 integrase [Klebsiella variicola]MBY0738843.1 site-specific integrase [Klebsiella sp. M589]MBY0748278.1 site-specific integrase [Klebsiella sp. M581]